MLSLIVAFVSYTLWSMYLEELLSTETQNFPSPITLPSLSMIGKGIQMVQ
jgi:hypothetical protein